MFLKWSFVSFYCLNLKMHSNYLVCDQNPKLTQIMLYVTTMVRNIPLKRFFKITCVPEMEFCVIFPCLKLKTHSNYVVCDQRSNLTQIMLYVTTMVRNIHLKGFFKNTLCSWNGVLCDFITWSLQKVTKIQNFHLNNFLLYRTCSGTILLSYRSLLWK